jgi:tRNA pseudouridine55 synthase
MNKAAAKSRQKRRWQEVHGLLLLDKPAGMTSNQALQQARRLLNAAKAGHTGSLDPMATGLLPCCFGDATRLAQYMLDSDKTYEATLRVGWQTDTGDATGEKTLSAPVPALTADIIEQACQGLTGAIQQVPPMYSALHHQGKRLYELARQGIEVERPPRPVTIHQFELLAVRGDEMDFRITVSKGTYIRTLLEDLAQALGTRGHMTQLRRLRVGVLQPPLVSLSELAAAEQPESLLLGLDYALQEYPELTLSADQTRDLVHGKRIQCKEPTGIYRLYDPGSEFLGLGEALGTGQLRVVKLFLKSYGGRFAVSPVGGESCKSGNKA